MADVATLGYVVPMSEGTCGWCGSDCKFGEVRYEGRALVIRAKGLDRAWAVHPEGEGLGGTPFVVSGADQFFPDIPDHEAWFADVVLVAGAHPTTDDSNVLIEIRGNARPARSTTFKWEKDAWVHGRGAQAVRLAKPVGLEDRAAQALAASSLWASTDEAQFADGRHFLTQRGKDRSEEANRRAFDRWRVDRAELTTAGEAQQPDPRAFVNPYNFVPLGAGLNNRRREPNLHLGIGDGRRTGRIRVEYTAVTPLAISGTGRGEEADPHRPIFDGNSWIVPGSSLSGPVRAIHEALTDSCLRVVDLDYVPVHRDAAKPRNSPNTRIGHVVDAGGRLTIRCAAPVQHDRRDYPAIWVPSQHLSGHANFKPGDKFHWNPQQQDLKGGNRLALRAGKQPPQRCNAPQCAQDHWATIVSTPVGARGKAGKAYWYPFYALTRMNDLDLPRDVIDRYEVAARGSRDVVAVKRNNIPGLGVPGFGIRRQVHDRPTDGDVMWVTLERGQVTRVTPSVVWRDQGEHPVLERIIGYEPCTSPDALCPSCATFGMVEERQPRSGDGEPAALRAYKGHVRFGHGTCSEVQNQPTRLVEMGAPKPSAGQFYLRNEGWAGKRATDNGRPLREWGSSADDIAPRRIAGRKFWWKSESQNRHAVPDGVEAHPTMSTWHCLSPIGTTIAFPVWFDNLTRPQIGALMLSLCPDLIRCSGVLESLRSVAWSPEERAHLNELLGLTMVTQVGKGKGVGLGVVHSSISATDDEPALMTWGAERYLGPSDEVIDDKPETFVNAFIESLTFEITDQGRERLLATLSLLALNWVPGSVIHYPPDDAPGEDFQFDFWRKSTGAESAVDGTQPDLVTLPKPTNADARVKPPWR